MIVCVFPGCELVRASDLRFMSALISEDFPTLLFPAKAISGSSFCGAITDTPVKAKVAMTGEITLRGRVLPIGGLKEKLLAAKSLQANILNHHLLFLLLTVSSLCF